MAHWKNAECSQGNRDLLMNNILWKGSSDNFDLGQSIVF